MAIYAKKQKKKSIAVQAESKKIEKEKLQKQQEEQLLNFAKEQIAIDKQVLMSKFPFTGNVISRLDVEIGDFPDIKTACTDGNKIWVNLLFYINLDSEEKLFVLAHECWHVILRHFLRKMNRNRELWNWATDLEIHFLLTKEGLKAPFVLPHDPEWKDLSFEEIYDRLLQEAKNTRQRGESRKGKKGKSGGRKKNLISSNELGEGDDINDFEEDNNGDDENETEIPEHWNKGKESKNLKRQKGEGQGFDSHDKNIPDGVEEEKEDPKEIESQISKKITAASNFIKKRYRGTAPGYIQQILDSLPKGEIPWQQLLRQYVTQTIGGSKKWIPPNRRYVWKNKYIQSNRSDSFTGIVAIDTSGSTEEYAGKFFGELVSLLNSFGRFNIKVIQCDADIVKVDEYNEDTFPPNNTKWIRYGNGGTDFRPVFDYIKKNEEKSPEVVLFLTDGYGPYPIESPLYPTIWLVTPNGKKNDYFKWGQVIRFSKDK